MLSSLKSSFKIPTNFTSRAFSTIENNGEKKFTKKMQYRPIIQNQRKRNEELEAEAKKSGKDWRIVTATILHRYPVITKESPKWRNDFLEVQKKIDTYRREKLVETLKGTDALFIPEVNPSFQDIEATIPFQAAPRLTEADATNDRHSLDRRLSDSLFLIVKRNRNDKSWQFPQGKILEEETSILEAGERIIDRAIGKSNRYFITNAPVGHYLYAYPPALQEKRNQFGAKVFYTRAQLIDGSVKLETRLYKDYAWIARDEVEEYFDPETAVYIKALLPN